MRFYQAQSAAASTVAQYSCHQLLKHGQTNGRESVKLLYVPIAALIQSLAQSLDILSLLSF
ncbi:hypothetical protein ACKFKG_22710 [Phormidesmis sp. 146-35]